MTAERLLAECVLPGCHEAVVTVGEPCPECVAIFGPVLVRNAGGRPITQDDIDARDRGSRAAYAAHRLVRPTP